MEKSEQSIPTFECRPGCSDCCKAILVGRGEWARIVERIGYAPHMDHTVERCPLLDGDRCSVYDIRPTICRIFGAVEDLRCPHGCAPEKLLTHDEAATLLWDSVKEGFVGD